MSAKEHDFTDFAKEQIRKTIGRIKGNVSDLEHWMKNYSEVASKGDWEYYKRCEQLIERDKNGD